MPAPPTCAARLRPSPPGWPEIKGAARRCWTMCSPPAPRCLRVVPRAAPGGRRRVRPGRLRARPNPALEPILAPTAAPILRACSASCSSTRDTAQHRQRHPPGGQHRLRVAPDRTARLRWKTACCSAPGLTITSTHARRHASWQAFLASETPAMDRPLRLHHPGSQLLGDALVPGDWLVFGSETAGLPPSCATASRPRSACAPADARRSAQPQSLNAVAVAVFDAWRQNGYAGGG